MVNKFYFLTLSKDQELDVYGTLRSAKFKNYFKLELHEKIFSDIDVFLPNILDDYLKILGPDYIILY